MKITSRFCLSGIRADQGNECHIQISIDLKCHGVHPKAEGISKTGPCNPVTDFDDTLNTLMAYGRI